MMYSPSAHKPIRLTAKERKILSQPLVSIVTPTWRRANVLMKRLVPSIAKQTYPLSRIEHIIVSDGLDDKVRMLEYELPLTASVYELGRNSTSLVPNSFGVVPNQVGCWLATGKYITCVADDDIMHPDHLQKCIDFLEDEPSIGFVYTGFIHRTGKSAHIVQSVEPRAGTVASPVFRASLLGISSWQLGEGMSSDFKLVQRWLDADVEYGFIDDVTFEHFADH